MKKLLLLKSLLLLCALVVGNLNGWAAVGDEITNHADIVSGNYYYIKAVVGTTSYYLKFTDATGNSVSGTDDTNTANAQIIRIESAGEANKYYLKTANGYYMTPAASNGKLVITSTATSVTASTANNLISFSITSGTDTWTLQRNNNEGTHNFGGYKSSQKKVTLIEAPAPKVDVVSIGDISTKKLDYNDTGTFTVGITGATGITASDYSVIWTEVSNEKLTLLEDGTYEAGTTAGKVQVTVTVNPAASKTSTHKAVSKSFNIRVFDPTKNNGTSSRPYTVAEAKAVYDDGESTTDDKKGVCVRGRISNIYYVNTGGETGYAKYDISADGTTSGDQLQAYNGFYTGNTKFTSEDQIAVGDVVIIYGDLSKYSSTYQLAAGNYIVSQTPDTRVASDLAWSDDAVEIDKDASLYTLPSLSNPHGLTVSYTITGTAGLASESAGVVTVDTSIEGSATVTASFAGDEDYKAAAVSYTITVVDKTKPGSIYNPYTVADIEGQASATTYGNNIYVTGYIVGSISGNKCYKTTTANLVDTNLLLADTPDVSFTEGAAVASNSDGLIPVELPSSPSSLRTNWGVASNNVIGYKVLLKGNAMGYFGTNAIKGTSEISAVAVPVTVGTSKYAAYCSTYALDFSATEVKAYKAKVDGGKVVLTKVDEVPANTGVILYGDADNYTVPVIASAAAVTENELIGVTTRTLVEWTTGGDGKYNYILQGGQFKKAATGGYLKANRAYLHTSYDVTSATARDYLEFSFEGEEETTGVNEVTTTNRTNNMNEFFNLAGQRVAQPTKGLYIVNGKKVVIK